MQEVFIEFSSLHSESYDFFKGWSFKPFSLFDAPFSIILKKYRSFATVHYTLVATSAIVCQIEALQSHLPG